MAKQKLTILQVVARSGISKRTNQPWEIHTAQCVLEQDSSDGKQILVGTINLPTALKDSPAGEYLAEFALQQSMEGKLEPRIVSLVPFGRPTAKPAANVTA
ncbi:cellulose synthase [Burkholderia pseudomallei]|uniref:cellulose synthase n=1 Tax=Burkholderia pseudomallei TaxID=28450 RepID=UPI000A1A1724|nr:cellulose synthase [Burkholderia pseudomallei]ARK49162.1 cellulose synthase [Burkholderia pseudomallei]MCL4670288.1 cellulose synthase [Burkholderia pseudomallei]MEB5483303.1 cellulose synthase [Burkholderia pseudomallei]MEB5490142.1 cellulose synthase [Burkholderia pseudomallei]MEB5496554.1 cellulose synthase [Burkholderia pseudomallei]